MFLRYILLTALVSSGTALLSNNAQAQSVDSASLIKLRIVAAQAKDSTKAQTRIIRLVSQSTIPVGNRPLCIVDGKQISEQDFKSINPNDIDKIEVLKGVNAVALYGSRATNGVILMTLKHPRTKPLRQPITKKGRLD